MLHFSTGYLCAFNVDKSCLFCDFLRGLIRSKDGLILKFSDPSWIFVSVSQPLTHPFVAGDNLLRSSLFARSDGSRQMMTRLFFRSCDIGRGTNAESSKFYHRKRMLRICRNVTDLPRFLQQSKRPLERTISLTFRRVSIVNC